MTKPILARDLGDGPFKAFGSALHGGDGGHSERCPVIGRTVKPRAAGPCKVCGEKQYFCECEDGQ